MKGVIGVIIALIFGSLFGLFLRNDYYKDKIVYRTELVSTSEYAYKYYNNDSWVELVRGASFDLDHVIVYEITYYRGSYEFDLYTICGNNLDIDSILDNLRSYFIPIDVVSQDVYLTYADYYKRYFSLKRFFEELNTFPAQEFFNYDTGMSDLIADLLETLTDEFNFKDVFNILTGGSYYIAWFLQSIIKNFFITIKSGLTFAGEFIKWLSSYSNFLDHVFYTTIPYKTILVE